MPPSGANGSKKSFLILILKQKKTVIWAFFEIIWTGFRKTIQNESQTRQHKQRQTSLRKIENICATSEFLKNLMLSFFENFGPRPAYFQNLQKFPNDHFKMQTKYHLSNFFGLGIKIGFCVKSGICTNNVFSSATQLRSQYLVK